MKIFVLHDFWAFNTHTIFVVSTVTRIHRTVNVSID